MDWLVMSMRVHSQHVGNPAQFHNPSEKAHISLEEPEEKDPRGHVKTEHLFEITNAHHKTIQSNLSDACLDRVYRIGATFDNTKQRRMLHLELRSAFFHLKNQKMGVQ